MAACVIEATDIAYQPARRPGGFALRVTSFAPEPGIHFLVGLNGSGKSTLIKLLSGVRTPQSGAVTFRGRALTDRRVFRDYCAASGYLWQDFALHGRTPVLDYLAYRAWLKGFDPRDGRAMATAGLRASGLEGEADKPVGRLSGGMQRRIGIAAETLGNPAVLLLDEPTAGLDIDARERFYAALDEMVKADATVIVAAHDLADLTRYDGTVHVLVQGTIARSRHFAAGQLTGETLQHLVRGTGPR